MHRTASKAASQGSRHGHGRTRRQAQVRRAAHSAAQGLTMPLAASSAVSVRRPQAKVPSVRLALSDEVKLGWKGDDVERVRLIPRNEAGGASASVPGGSPGASRDLVIGLDFGTSSTKVVVADHTLNDAYAVPFVDSVGVGTYLLPSALIETADGLYVLSGEGKRHADMKLAMLANTSDDEACARVCAYLALVIRHTRAWLFEAKRNQYIRADILWTLALGQPADQAESAEGRTHYEQVARVAWYLAGCSGAVKAGPTLNAWRERSSPEYNDELEIRVMAELSAQIHGFVSSSHFDARQPNIYLIVDVGAGTVDASLFQVRRDSGGTVSFSLFTHSVEVYGAANLNRYRLNWWQSQLDITAQGVTHSNPALARRAQNVKHELECLKLPTEYRGRYPEHYTEYIKGVIVSFLDGAQTPDAVFQLKVRNQVAGKVLYGAWKNRLLDQAAIKGMPFFLCGGGARHSFYAALKTGLQSTPNCTWLSAKPRDLVRPANMSAPGVLVNDYDRLSVAYGLSQLYPGAFERVSAMEPIVPIQRESTWNMSLTDKSIC